MSYGYPDPQQRRPFRLRLLPILIGAVMIGVTMISQCQEGPFGRKQIVALNPEQEKALGAQAFQEVLSTERRLTSGPLVDAVRTIADRLTVAAENPKRYLDMLPGSDWLKLCTRNTKPNAAAQMKARSGRPRRRSRKESAAGTMTMRVRSGSVSMKTLTCIFSSLTTDGTVALSCIAGLNVPRMMGKRKV